MELKVIIIFAVLAGAGCIQDLSFLELSDDPNVQIEQVLDFIQLSKSDINFTLLYKNLRETLEPVWPRFKLLQFGSLVSGLGIKSSDVDHLIMVPNTTTKGVDLARQAYELFQQRPDIYKHVQLKTDKRVPIVMFWHISSGWHSDLTFSEPASVRASELIGYILNIDPRAVKLAKLIKYWSKIHNINGTEMLSTYCHYLQLIHFLQQKKILPAIIDLQKNVTGMFSDWNTEFKTMEYTTSNDESLLELFGGYFKYYSVFDYKRYIISPYLGRVLERKVFKSLDTVPEEYVLYKHNVLNGITHPYSLEGRISVQDTFEHNRNTAALNEVRTRRVISHYNYAVKMLVENNKTFLRNILTRDKSYELANVEE